VTLALLNLKKIKDMYKLLVRWMDNQVMERTINDVNQLRGIINSVKGGVVFATLVSPSGVTKEITEHFNK
jgi:hypothetical protein